MKVITFTTDRNPPHPVRLGHVQNNLLVDHQLVVQRQIVAIWIDLRLVERVDQNIVTETPQDFLAGDDHGNRPAGEKSGKNV